MVALILSAIVGWLFGPLWGVFALVAILVLATEAPKQ